MFVFQFSVSISGFFLFITTGWDEILAGKGTFLREWRLCPLQCYSVEQNTQMEQSPWTGGAFLPPAPALSHLLPSEIPGGEKPQPMRESQPKWPKQLKNVKQFWQSFYRQFFFKIMGWLHLERIFEIIMSSCYPSTTPDPKCHILQIPPWMVTPPLPWTAHCSAQQPFGRRNAF